MCGSVVPGSRAQGTSASVNATYVRESSANVRICAGVGARGGSAGASEGHPDDIAIGTTGFFTAFTPFPPTARLIARHDLGRHQLHRALAERADRPSPCRRRRARRSRRPASRSSRIWSTTLLTRAVDAPARRARTRRVISASGWLRGVLNTTWRLACIMLGWQLLPVEAVGAVRVVAAVAARGLVVVGDEDRARDAPVGRVGRHARLCLALGVVRPVARQPVRQQEVRRQRMEVALAHRDHAFRERRHHGADDLRARLLEGLVHRCRGRTRGPASCAWSP